MMTLEQYLRVAQMWYAEQEEDYNPYNLNGLNESFESMPKAGRSVSDDGWVDYAEDQVNNIPEKEFSEVCFILEICSSDQLCKLTFLCSFFSRLDRFPIIL